MRGKTVRRCDAAALRATIVQAAGTSRSALAVRTIDRFDLGVEPERAESPLAV
ncbi:MAG: hypothetical protein OXB91_08990 [Bryobacterales bacterium]|nr:hypothetical protein [Bryobacterales bacterium]